MSALCAATFRRRLSASAGSCPQVLACPVAWCEFVGSRVALVPSAEATACLLAIVVAVPSRAKVQELLLAARAGLDHLLLTGAVRLSGSVARHLTFVGH